MSSREFLGSSWERDLREQLLAAAVQRDPGPPADRRPMFLAVRNHFLSRAYLVDRVRLGGLLSLVWASIWCRREAPAHAGSPVPWDPTERQPWIVELHGWWPDRDRQGCTRLGVVFSVPCPVDPREPSPEADAAIRWVVARALLHEGQEGTLIDGVELDPHNVGEIGLAEVGAALGVRVDPASEGPA